MNNMTKHGFTTQIEHIGELPIVVLKAVGKLTHEDYQAMTPIFEAALQQLSPHKIKVLVDISDLEGWDMHAAWDDLKLGIKHGADFEKIAILGDKHWQEWAAKVGGWFMSGEIKSFEYKDAALLWLHS
ncbi:STAS/SEC14 domain-containing protein [Vibrio sp. S11_S32]|uniref:STAS/SEC14 domain-containing protein n=1 Tax=Vibrio sp. S11_S32 TaxID=2720225 RepID=UPI001680370C|nr:STAS/SEC14 domain-containing protein [Vibrio sp. S11_S32]MBD1577483.1 STAS/SEC14 domain-containing protein [Vibrio sp. S11_S32]